MLIIMIIQLKKLSEDKYLSNGGTEVTASMLLAGQGTRTPLPLL